MTRIEWADETWNPVTGCTPVSEGCKNCYARRMANRMRGRFGYPEDEPFRPTLHPGRLIEPLKWKKPKKVFLCSMGDLFGDDVPAEFIDEILEVIAACPQHTFILLTKRPGNIETKFYEVTEGNPCRELGGGDYLPNLWLGVTAEDQKTADQRIPTLLQIPAAVRFVSVEPMLGPVDLWPFFSVVDKFGEPSGPRCDPDGSPAIKWVICGGETGPGARPMDPDWARSLRDQCREAGVPFFMKKMSGGLTPPPDLMVRQWPNVKNGPRRIRRKKNEASRHKNLS